MEEKFYADGWSSTLAQMALANAFADPELNSFLASASRAYAEQRRRLCQVITKEVAGRADIRVVPSSDGPNIWLQLPRRISATSVAKRAAALGILLATGEPFFINVGRDDALRVNAGIIAVEDIDKVGRKIASAILEVTNSISEVLFQHSL
jgi:DNA-binding transcriptional MocR family regulator